MLRTDVVVVETLRFLLRERQNPARSFCEFIKSVCHIACLAPPIPEFRLAYGFLASPTLDRPPTLRFCFLRRGIGGELLQVESRECSRHLGLGQVLFAVLNHLGHGLGRRRRSLTRRC